MNPRTAEWLKDPSFMTKLQMLKKNPQMFSVLMQQDPRLSEAFNMLISDFGGMGGAAASAAANSAKNASTFEEEPAAATSTSNSSSKPDFTMEEEIPEQVQREVPKPAPT